MTTTIPKVQTTRLALKTYDLTDTPKLYNLLERNSIGLSLSFPLLTEACATPEKTAIFIETESLLWEAKKKYSFGIFHKENQELIGHVFLKNINWAVPKCEVGYLIDKKYHNRGYATEALRAMIAFGARNLQLNKMYLRVILGNRASARVACKAGFELEGVLQNDFRTSMNELVDVEYYGLVF